MALSKQDKKFFRELESEVKTALRLLKKQRKKALRGVGHYEPHSCPIACAYGVHAGHLWDSRTTVELDILEKNGWNRGAYQMFIYWYDANNRHSVVREWRARFLKRYLSGR